MAAQPGRQPFTALDDRKIVELVALHGTRHWTKIAESLETDPEVSTKRSGKQCRER
jgi:hypothetical protein